MNFQPGRTVAATVLLAAAVTIPCAAWYVAGSRATEREAADLRSQRTREAQHSASRSAERLHGRLTAIREAESRRPFYHYRFQYPDASENCECATWVESPLSHGPAEPFVRTHFEIDRSGRVTIPRIPGDGFPENFVPDRESMKILAELRAASSQLAHAGWEAERARSAARSAASTTVLASATAAPATEGRFVPFGDATVLVDPFVWRTVEIAGCLELVALRTVFPPEGARIQGFVVSQEAVEDELSHAAFPSRFRPDAAPGDVSQPLGLEDVSWSVTVDAGRALAYVERDAETLRRAFLRTFWSGTGAAALAALFVVGVVRRSERLARERSHFAASAAHELRTPLAGLRVYGEMLADELGDPDKSRSYARQVAAEAERLGRVVSNVLGYTRMERGPVEVRVQPGDVGAAVREAVERMRPSVESHGATLELSVEGESLIASFDPDALFQILQNLVDNAERYGRQAADRAIRVEVAREQDDVRISVRDSGPGIPSRLRRRLFRPFVRGDDPDAPAGLGLGLALVSTLAKAQDARVSSEDAPGGGAIFTVSLRT